MVPPVATDAETATIAQAAASELARLLPADTPLVVADSTKRPSKDAVAVRASFVGATSADLFVVTAADVVKALADAEALSLADALRPALEAASATLGQGVLDVAVSGPLDGSLDEDGVVVVALAPTSDAAPQAWFGIRLRPHVDSVPAPRHTPRASNAERVALRLLHDVEMILTAEIGRTRLPVRQVLDLVPGTVLELDRPAGAPADIMVNGRLIARGEVVVIDEDYGIRITEIVSHETT
jgi:flagellar motor switch protein FliN